MPIKTITARSARKSATLFDIGNIIVTLFPVLIPFWLGASIFVYTSRRHHPNPLVGEHTQWAAYRFYGMIGAIVSIAIIFPGDVRYYLAAWAVAAVAMIPWSIWSLHKINREDWQDTEYES